MKTMFKSPEHASSVQEIYRFITLKKKTEVLLFIKQCPRSFTYGNE